MHVAIVPALGATLFLLGPVGVSAQYTATLPQAPQSSLAKMSTIAKPQDALKNAEAGSPADHTDPANPLPLPNPLLQPRTACAHILIFQAPNMDSKMIVEVPPDLGGNITTFKGLGTCCRDLRGLHGLPPILPKAPFRAPGKNLAPAANLELWLKRPKP